MKQESMKQAEQSSLRALTIAAPQLWPLVETVIAKSGAAGYLKVDQPLPK